MKKWIYPEVVENLKSYCDEFVNGKISVVELQTEIYKSEQQIVAIDESWFRKILFNTENKIESLLYTTDNDKIFEAVCVVVGELLTYIKKYEFLNLRADN